MVRDQSAGGGGHRTRRDVLRTLGGGGAVALAGCGGDGGTPTPESQVDFLLATSQSGEYGSVGTNQQRGFDLAIDHLNEGGGLVDAVFDDLSGDGLLGREVSGVTEDTQNTADTARSVADRRLSGDGIGMVTGGVGGDVVLAVSDVAADNDVPYMAGTVPNPAVTGAECRPTTFRVHPPASAIVDALGGVLSMDLSDELSYAQVSTRGSEGAALADTIFEYYDRDDTPAWEPATRVSARPGAETFEEILDRAEEHGPDVVFLNLFGLDAINGVTAAREILSEDVTVVVPIIDDTLGQAVEEDMEGIVGTVPWDANVGGTAAATFDDAYTLNYGPSSGGTAQTGSGTAHLIYVQTLVYAAAAERAGSLAADSVVSELEGTTYDVGLGTEELRACDHQARRRIPVVRGTAGTFAGGNRMELVRSFSSAVGGCDEPPAANCSF